jgi:DNA polymerase III subunit beta
VQPRKTVLEIVKLLEGDEGDVEVSLSASKIRFKIGNLLLTSKLIDGTFPDYERVIPRNNDKILVTDAKEFASAVDRVSTISMEKSRAVKLALSKDRLGLVVNNPDSGSAEEEIVVEYDQDAIEIGFNARYLMDVAGQITAETVRFEFQDAGSPTVVRDPKDEKSLYVLMPMRV